MISRTLRGIDVYKELLSELELCRGSLITIREPMAMVGREEKPKLMYMVGCAFILHIFSVKHIPVSGKDLMNVVSLRMLKWDAITQHKSFSSIRTVFIGMAKQVILDLEPT